MKKIMSRCLVLFALLTCLGLVSATDFRGAQNPPCPLGCHDNCRSDYDDCRHECGFDLECVHKRCKPALDSCLAYCDWVCGPE